MLVGAFLFILNVISGVFLSTFMLTAFLFSERIFPFTFLVLFLVAVWQAYRDLFVPSKDKEPFIFRPDEW